MATIKTKRPNPLRRMWLTLRLWCMVYQIDSAERYLLRCQQDGIAEGFCLYEYRRTVEALEARMRTINKELEA